MNEEGLTTVRLVPGKLQDGIALNILPRILQGTDRLSLNITLRTTRIKGISRFPADAGPNDPVIPTAGSGIAISVVAGSAAFGRDTVRCRSRYFAHQRQFFQWHPFEAVQGGNAPIKPGC